MATVVILNTAGPAITKLVDRVSAARLREVVGPRVTRLVQDHLIARDAAQPNRLGGARTHFYSGAAQATTWREAGDDVVIAIDQLGIRQRYLGGLIRPVKTKRLAIPARAESYGKAPGEFRDLTVAFLGGGRLALVRASQSLIRFVKSRKTGQIKVKKIGAAGGEILFWLVPEVTQAADPAVLPARADLVTETVAAISEAAMEGIT